VLKKKKYKNYSV